jgi:hypothetical protein
LAQVANQEAVENEDADPIPLLLKRLRHFTRRNTTDYFIHKNLNRFLVEELEFYIKDQILHIGDLEGDFETKRRMLRTFRQLANSLITFLAQIEDVQLKLFEKRKFVLRADYLVTMAHVPKELWKEILDSKAGAKQLSEWKKLYAFDECAELLGWKGKLTEAFLVKHPTLVINTAKEGLIYSRCAEPSVPGVGQQEPTLLDCKGPVASCRDVPVVGLLLPHSHTRPLCSRQQTPSSQVQIRQATGDKEPTRILCQPAVPHCGPSKDPLDYQKHMFDFRADFRLGAIAGALRLVQGPVAIGFGLDEVPGSGGALADHVALPAVGRVTPHARLLPMQQIWQHLAGMHIRRRRGH